MMNPQNNPVPEDYYCPISHLIMFDPVVAEDGETYEREEIEKHFETLRSQNKQLISPIHQTEIGSHLNPNGRLARNIKNFINEHPQFAEEVYVPRRPIQNLIAAINSGDKEALLLLLDKNKWLLEKNLIENKKLTEFICEQPNLEVVTIVLEYLKKEKKISLLRQDLEKLLLICHKSTGHQGVKLLLQNSLEDLTEIKTLIHEKIKQGDLKILEILLSAQLIDINASLDEEQNTGLHLAVQYNQPEVAKLLIALGVNSKSINKEGYTPEKIALSQNNQSFVQQIVEWRKEKKTTKLVERMEILEKQIQEQHNFHKNTMAFFNKNLKISNHWPSLTSFKFAGQFKKVLADGTILTASSDNKIIRIWDLKTRECVQMFNGQFKRMLSDECFLIESSDNETHELWDCNTKKLHPLKGQFEQMLANGSIITRNSNNSMLWDAKTKQYVGSYSGNFKQLLPNGNILATVSSGSDTLLWEISTGKTYAFTGALQSVLSNGNILTASGETVSAWDSKTGKCLYTITGQFKQLSANDVIVTLSPDRKSTQLWGTKVGDCLHTIVGKYQQCLSDEFMLIYKVDNQTSEVWDIINKECKGYLVQVLSNGNVITSNQTGTMLWDNKTRKTYTFTGRYQTQLNDGSVLFNTSTSTSNESYQLWNAKTQQVSSYNGSLQVIADTIMCISSPQQNISHIYNSKTGNMCTINGSYKLALAGGSIVSCDSSQKAQYFWDAETEAIVKLPDTNATLDQLKEVQILPNNSILMNASNSFVQWDLLNEDKQINIFSNTLFRKVLAILPNGDMLMDSLDNSQTTQLWDAARKQFYPLKSVFKQKLIDGSILTEDTSSTYTYIYDLSITKEARYTLVGRLQQTFADGSILTSRNSTTQLWDAKTRQIHTLDGTFKQVLGDGSIVVDNGKNTVIWKVAKKHFELRADFTEEEIDQLKHEIPECKIA